MRKYQKDSTPPRSLLRFSPNKLGFTLIELLVVITVLGVLATIVLLAVNPGAQLARARDAGRKTALKIIKDAIARYYVLNIAYPSPTCNWCGSWSGSNWIPDLITSRELQTIPVDPINMYVPGKKDFLYKYTSNGTDYCIQVGFETDISTDPLYSADYRGFWDGTYHLRIGPSGPFGGLCI